MEVSEETFVQEVLERSVEEPVLVDFWASWCPPCRQLAPIIEQASAEHGVRLTKVDVDANPGLAERYGVSGIPAVKAFRHGEVVAEFVGLRGRPALDAFIEELGRPAVVETLEGDPELVDVLRTHGHEAALELLLARAADPSERDEARRVMVELFGELGQSHPLATAYRKRLAALVY